MAKTFDPYLVALSVLVAVFVSHTALALIGRVSRNGKSKPQKLWILAGGIAMGCGIWAMHFLGMLALKIPVRLTYDLLTTLASLLLAMGTSVIALIVAARPQVSPTRLAGSAALLSAGICGMHYLGMSAIQLAPAVSHDPALVLVSLAVAFGGCYAALWVRLRVHGALGPMPTRAASAVILGLSIGGSHYIGMWAARISAQAYWVGAGGADNGWLAVVIATIAFALMGIMTVLLAYDGHLCARLREYHSSLEDVAVKLEYAATHDALTGLPNRSFLLQRLEDLATHPATHQRNYGLLLIDLDRFKEINDSLGHQAGDQLLCTLGERLASQIRGNDIVARLGGDEFVVLADRLADAREAHVLAARLQRAIAQPVTLCGLQVHVTASIGVALSSDSDTHGTTLLQRADSAMYHVKNNGRSGIQVFSGEVHVPSRERLETDDGLRTALSANQLELFYQPKVDVRTGRVEGAEALVRWRHPERGLIPPNSFIPLAEETGLIVPIGEWVLREACRQVREWSTTKVGRLRVAVNVSAQQLERGDFAEVVTRILQDSGVEASLLELEITETTVMRNAELSIRALRRLSEFGVTIALDDFGTGYSSLSQLRQLPLSKLKIDRSFLKELASGGADTIVRSIVSLAHNMNLRVVAEGVETTEQLQFLREIGCDKYQGYLFSQPLCAEEFADRVIASRISAAHYVLNSGIRQSA